MTRRAFVRMLLVIVSAVAPLGACAAQPGALVPSARIGTTTQSTGITHARRTELPGHCPATARACVDLSARLAWLQHRGHVRFGPVRIAIGGRAHPTPSGNFGVAWKARHWVSTEYGIPMPYAVFFAAGGIAFHEGPLARPSHGCIHLTRAAARRFYAALSVGARVHVE